MGTPRFLFQRFLCGGGFFICLFAARNFAFNIVHVPKKSIMANAQAAPDHLSGQLERICSFIKLLNGSNIVPIAYVVLMKQKGNKIIAEPTRREKQVTNFFIAIWAAQNL